MLLMLPPPVAICRYSVIAASRSSFGGADRSSTYRNTIAKNTNAVMYQDSRSAEHGAPKITINHEDLGWSLPTTSTVSWCGGSDDSNCDITAKLYIPTARGQTCTRGNGVRNTGVRVPPDCRASIDKQHSTRAYIPPSHTVFNAADHPRC